VGGKVTDPVRDRSKQLLGGMYRAEIIAAIAEIGDHAFTVMTLEDVLASGGVRVPPSLLHKELTILKTWGLLDRHARNETGHYVFTRRKWAAFWDVLSQFTEHELPEDDHAPVVPLPVRNVKS
jgi:hypothetical protein